MSRRRLFEDEPIAELRGLSSLTDPDRVGGVIDVAVFGARGDGKTQFIVHAIRTLRAHAPQLEEAERQLNREVLRVVLDPRAPRPEATPPGFVPHYTFRVRPASVLSRLAPMPALRLLWRAAPTRLAASALSALAAFVALGAAVHGPSLRLGGVALAAAGVAVLAALAAGRSLRRAPELEVAFWDIAGEHVYSASAADYYSLLSSLIAARKRRAAELGRPYCFAPVLLCNPIALGTREAASPFERLRQLLPLFAAIDERGGRALIAINRWSIVDPICVRGALRDEIVEVSAASLGEPLAEARRVARDLVREHCLDTEEGKDGDVTIAVLRYDTALSCTVAPAKPGEPAAPATAGERDEGSLEHAAALTYRYDEGPGAFTGAAASAFLDWLLRGLRVVDSPEVEPLVEAGAEAPRAAAAVGGGVVAAAGEPWAPRPSSELRTSSGAGTSAVLLPALGPALPPEAPREAPTRAAAIEPVAAEVWARPSESGTAPGLAGGDRGGLR